MQSLLKALNREVFKLSITSITFLSFSTFLLLHKPLESLFNNLIVERALSKIESKWYNDLIFLIIASWFIFLFFQKWRNYFPSRNITWLLCFFTTIHLYYRIIGTIWIYIGFSFVEMIKYADTIFIICLVNILLFLFKKKTIISKMIDMSFLDDRPLGQNFKDELGYTKYAFTVSSMVQRSFFENSFAIGINAKWGLGKTSFLDLIKRNLNDDNIITINFNPWNSYSPQAIIKDFFETVKEAIRPYHSSLAKMLLKYSSKLVSLNDNSITKSIKIGTVVLSGDDSLESIFKNINKSLIQINKKLVIYIDDLDRLDKDEILEVIRLIRNTANFHNTFFIVAYDKNYILRALKDHNAFNHEQFLEKIFQIEITLPHFKKKVLRKKLAENLKYAFSKEYHPKIDEALFGSSSVAPVFLDDWVNSMRDVTRLSNSIIMNLPSLFGEVSVIDFIKIEILRLRYPSVYVLIYTQKNYVFELPDNNEKHKKYILSMQDSKNTHGNNKEKESYLKWYLTEHSLELNVPENEITQIVNYIQSIFENSFSFSYYSKNLLSIVYPDKFNRYFSYGLLDDELSEVEFLECINLDEHLLFEKISNWVSKGMAYETQKRFMEIKFFPDRNQFEKVIKSIFYLANIPNTDGDFPIVVGYDGADLLDKLNNYGGNKSLLYGNLGAEGLKSFIQSIFDNATIPFIFESEFARYVDSKFLESNVFPISKTEINNISIKYLKDYCGKIGKLDSNAFSLLWNSEQTTYISQGNNSYSINLEIPQESKEIFKQLIYKNMDVFILKSIEFSPFNKSGFIISNFVEKLFNGWDNFESFISAFNIDQSIYISEFREFYNECKKQNFTQYINFDFKETPVKNKQNN